MKLFSHSAHLHLWGSHLRAAETGIRDPIRDLPVGRSRDLGAHGTCRLGVLPVPAGGLPVGRARGDQWICSSRPTDVSGMVSGGGCRAHLVRRVLCSDELWPVGLEQRVGLSAHHGWTRRLLCPSPSLFPQHRGQYGRLPSDFVQSGDARGRGSRGATAHDLAWKIGPTR